MDNVLTETTRTEIKAILGDKESRNGHPTFKLRNARRKMTRD